MEAMMIGQQWQTKVALFLSIVIPVVVAFVVLLIDLSQEGEVGLLSLGPASLVGSLLAIPALILGLWGAVKKDKVAVLYILFSIGWVVLARHFLLTGPQGSAH
jgi:hypothetical protein